MVNKEKVKAILQNLLANWKSIGYYTKSDVETAIILSCGADRRTIKNWFNVLWKLQYLTQPEPGIYNINVEKIAELEVKMPPQIDPKQARLSKF